MSLSVIMDEIMEFYKNNTEWIIIIVSINLMAIILYAILSSRRRNRDLVDSKKEIELYNKHQEMNKKLLDTDTAISEEFINKFNELTDEENQEEFVFEDPAESSVPVEVVKEEQTKEPVVEEKKVEIIPIVTKPKEEPKEEVKEEKVDFSKLEEVKPIFVTSDEFEEEDEELIDFSHLDNYDYYDSREEPITEIDVNQLINDELENNIDNDEFNIPVEPFLFDRIEDKAIDQAIEEYIPKEETPIEPVFVEVAPFEFEPDLEFETPELDKKEVSRSDFIISPVHGIVDPAKRQDFFETQKIERVPLQEENTEGVVEDFEFMPELEQEVSEFDASVFDEFASNFDLASGKTMEIVVPEFDNDDFDDEEGELIDLKTLERNNYDLNRVNEELAYGVVEEFEIDNSSFEKLSRENTPLKEKINDDNKYDSYLKKLKEFRANL